MAQRESIDGSPVSRHRAVRQVTPPTKKKATYLPHFRKLADFIPGSGVKCTSYVVLMRIGHAIYNDTQFFLFFLVFFSTKRDGLQTTGTDPLREARLLACAAPPRIEPWRHTADRRRDAPSVGARREKKNGKRGRKPAPKWAGKGAAPPPPPPSLSSMMI